MDDLISRTWLLAEYDKQHKGPSGGARKLIEEAPSALGTNLAEVGTDCISRQQAIDALKQQAETMSEWSNRYAEQRKGVLTAVNIIVDLPSAQPKRGKWIDRGEHGDWEWQADGRGKHWHEWECNICHHYFGERTFFCPHCGADMRGEQYG